MCPPPPHHHHHVNDHHHPSPQQVLPALHTRGRTPTTTHSEFDTHTHTRNIRTSPPTHPNALTKTFVIESPTRTNLFRQVFSTELRRNAQGFHQTRPRSVSARVLKRALGHAAAPSLGCHAATTTFPSCFEIVGLHLLSGETKAPDQSRKKGKGRSGEYRGKR